MGLYKKEKDKLSVDTINKKNLTMNAIKDKTKNSAILKTIFGLNSRINYYTIILFLLVIATVGFAGFSLYNRFSNKDNLAHLVDKKDDDSMNFIDIENGYIAEKLIVESGEILPSIKNYFSPDYKLADDVGISYFLDSSLAIPIEAFTYQNQNLRYVRGDSVIKVEITNGEKTYLTNLVIKDTTKPEVSFQNLTIVEGEELVLDNFITSYQDNSNTTERLIEVIAPLEYSNVGVYPMEIKVCDLSTNCVVINPVLTVTKKVSNNTNSNNNTNKKPSKGSTSSNGKTNKPSNNNNNNNSNNNNSNNSNNNNNNNNNSNNDSNTDNNKEQNKDKTTEGKGGSTITAAVERKAVKTYSKDNYNLVISHYGATETTFYEHVTYTLYSDGYIEVIAPSYGKSTSVWNFSTFKADLSLMKRDAMLLASHKDYQTAQNIFLKYTNNYRTEAGNKEVELDYHLCVLAQMRLYEIIYGNKLSHTRPNGKPFYSMITEYGYDPGTYKDGSGYFGENIAYGHKTHYDTIQALAKSEGHYKNLTDVKFKKMGVGTYAFNGIRYYVQLFSS